MLYHSLANAIHGQRIYEACGDWESTQIKRNCTPFQDKMIAFGKIAAEVFSKEKEVKANLQESSNLIFDVTGLSKN
mgnify:CR=1 FL=1